MMSTVSTMSVNTTTERPHTMRTRLRAIPWLTVLPLATLMAYADGFWMVSLRGATGAIERTQEPFASWLRESTLSLPVFVVAVVAALMLAARLFGPVLLTTKTVVAAALMVVAAGTVVGIYEVATSAAYDYSLQSGQAQQMASMKSGASTAQQQQASLGLQVRSVGYGSGILLITNLALVGWAVALQGGRLKVSTTRR
jgi:hypothetical protein